MAIHMEEPLDVAEDAGSDLDFADSACIDLFDDVVAANVDTAKSAAAGECTRAG